MTDKVFARCGLSSLFCSTSIASLVQVRAMSSRRSRTRMLDAMAICRHSAARSLHTSEVSMAVTPAAVLAGTPTSLGSAGFPTIEEALPHLLLPSLPLSGVGRMPVREHLQPHLTWVRSPPTSKWDVQRLPRVLGADRSSASKWRSTDARPLRDAPTALQLSRSSAGDIVVARNDHRLQRPS
jgi:hypothetical protein